MLNGGKFLSIEEAQQMEEINKEKLALRKERNELNRERADLTKERGDLRAEREQLRKEREALTIERDAIAKEWEELKKLRQRVVSGSKSGETSPTGFSRKQSEKNGRKKLTKADIGFPTDFQHRAHIGWNPAGGLEELSVNGSTDSMDPSTKAVLESAGFKIDHETFNSHAAVGNDVLYERSFSTPGLKARPISPFLTAPTELPPAPPVPRPRGGATAARSVDSEVPECPETASSRFSIIFPDEPPANNRNSMIRQLFPSTENIAIRQAENRTSSVNDNSTEETSTSKY